MADRRQAGILNTLTSTACIASYEIAVRQSLAPARWTAAPAREYVL